DKSTMEIQHVGADGKLKEGPIADDQLRTHRLTLDKLYGEDKDIDDTMFDCKIRFHSGIFRPSMVKTRRFKLDPAPTTPGTDPYKLIDSIAHNIVAVYTLDDQEELRVVIGKQTLWTSKHQPDSVRLLELEFIADHATAERYYCDCLKG